MNLLFFVNSALLGAGLAMDAFSVSAANGLGDPRMSVKRKLIIAGCFAGFQFLMPMLGWFFVRTAVETFTAFQPFIPWIALGLLCYIGGKMALEGIGEYRERKGETEDACTAAGHRLGSGELFVQGVATSIDALSVGFTITGYNAFEALVCCLIVAAVTFVLCLIGIELGRRAGLKLAGGAQVLGGIILIAIGIEVFVRGI